MKNLLYLLKDTQLVIYYNSLNVQYFMHIEKVFVTNMTKQTEMNDIFFIVDNNNPTITNDELINSLKTTNTYCLQGIENNIKLDESDEETDEAENQNNNKFAGLESVVKVFEEVLIWPSKYPQVFEKSPLRNQAGILLYGHPGTGKTYLVSQLSRIWNLRMISVKGPELLAKFIGQSEENVRNLFDR